MLDWLRVDYCLRWCCVDCLSVTTPLVLVLTGLRGLPVDLVSCGWVIVVGLIVLVIRCGAAVWCCVALF